MLYSRYDLYELCVQQPKSLVPFLVAVHGRSPRVLGEDFSGTAAISREWVRVVANGESHAVDHDREVLVEARRRCAHPELRLECADVMFASASIVDVLLVGNYSIGYFRTRASLAGYLVRCRARLSDAGVFVCDTYGGESAFRRGAIQRVVPVDANTTIRYTWEHREADAWTGAVTNAVHFRVERCGEIVQEITDAFVYDWRLWSVPELREVLHETGFEGVEVRETLDASAAGAPISPDFAVVITARNTGQTGSGSDA